MHLVRAAAAPVFQGVWYGRVALSKGASNNAGLRIRLRAETASAVSRETRSLPPLPVSCPG
jgi:hypothetical protein